jgi:protein-S-isoprenylcysteine O-methyltransferase Ste14
MIIQILAVTVRALWLVLEFPHVRRHRIFPSQNWDRQSAKLWDGANALEPAGLVLGFVDMGQIEIANTLIQSIGLVMLLAGIAIRWSAIRTLGKYFTGIVTIKNDHRLIRNGLYKHIRHPAYTGALLAHLGLGLSFASWFSIGFSSIPFFVAAFYRMRVEEQALEETFGADYLDYSTSTKRLIPLLY